jgi:hypothetical protein
MARTYRVAYGELIAPIVKAIQEQQAQLQGQKRQLQDQQKQVADLRRDNRTLREVSKSSSRRSA